MNGLQLGFMLVMTFLFLFVVFLSVFTRFLDYLPRDPYGRIVQRRKPPLDPKYSTPWAHRKADDEAD